MSYVSTSQGQLFYDIKGEGEALVLLRGLGRSSQYWLGYDEYLSKYFKVITMDYRGIGKSTVPLTWDTSIEDLAEDLVSVLVESEIESAHIFGLSLGGMIAMALAADYPQYCKSLMLANSSSADSTTFRIHPNAIKKLATASILGQPSQALMNLVTTDRVAKRIGHEITSHWTKILKEEGFPIDSVTKQLWAASRFKIKDRIDTAEVPTLILYGNQDHFVPPSNSKELHKLIVGSEIKVLRGVGHEITIGNESLLKNIIENFIDQNKETKLSMAI